METYKQIKVVPRVLALVLKAMSLLYEGFLFVRKERRRI